MRVTGGAADGIVGNGVTNLALISSAITNHGDTVGERGVDITGLFGTATVTNSTVTGSAEDNVAVQNSNGTLTALTIAGSQFTNTSTTVGNDGILFHGSGSAQMTLNVTGSLFDHNRGDHLHVATDALAPNVVMDVVFQGNVLSGDRGGGFGGTDVGGGVVISPSGNARVTFNISNNGTDAVPWIGATETAVIVNLGGTSTATAELKGTIANNVIGDPAIPDSGSSQGEGIDVSSHGAGKTIVAITNNKVRGYANIAGINLHIRDALGGNATARLDATVIGNIVSNPGTFATNGILAQAGAAAGDAQPACFDIGGAGALENTLVGSGAGGGTDFRVRQRLGTTVTLPGYAGAPTDTTAVVAFIQGRNAGTETGSATVQAPGGGFVGGAPCAQP
jgi:hypothetical protein